MFALGRTARNRHIPAKPSQGWVRTAIRSIVKPPANARARVAPGLEPRADGLRATKPEPSQKAVPLFHLSLGYERLCLKQG